MSAGKKASIAAKAKFLGIGAVVGLILGIACTIFVLNFNPPDEKKQLSTSAVFERIVNQNELVSVSQNYSIVDKASSSSTFFDLFDIPFTENSFWYRYEGTLKAGVNLKEAGFAQDGNVIKVVLDQPYIISNTPNMEKSGVLEERNNIFNPIHVEDTDEFQRLCIEMSQAEAVDNGLLDEAKTNAEQDIHDMFNAAFGEEYTVEFEWRETAEE